MNRFLFYIILFTLFSCRKQSQESKNKQNEQVTQQEVTAAIPIKKYDSITIDSKFASKLSKKEIASIFTRRRQNQLGISNTVYQAYSYKDSFGEYYLLLTDHIQAINEEKDTLYDNIYALNITKKGNQLKRRSTIKDEIDKEWETSIEFWNKYSELSDLDKDGLVDLILVYGTLGQDMYTDGRTKIMIYHNKKRITIRHQNSEFDDGRITKIDKRFYILPPQVQQAVKEKMRLMTQNGHAIFSGDWEKKMAKEATHIEGR